MEHHIILLIIIHYSFLNFLFIIIQIFINPFLKQNFLMWFFLRQNFLWQKNHCKISLPCSFLQIVFLKKPFIMIEQKNEIRVKKVENEAKKIENRAKNFFNPQQKN